MPPQLISLQVEHWTFESCHRLVSEKFKKRIQTCLRDAGLLHHKGFLLPCGSNILLPVNVKLRRNFFLRNVVLFFCCLNSDKLVPFLAWLKHFLKNAPSTNERSPDITEVLPRPAFVTKCWLCRTNLPVAKKKSALFQSTFWHHPATIGKITIFSKVYNL